MWFFTTSGSRLYTDVAYGRDDFLLFGKETAGLPKWLLEKHPKQCLRIPMGKNIRSLNLSNSVAIVLYEALRQQGFPDCIETCLRRQVLFFLLFNSACKNCSEAANFVPEGLVAGRQSFRSMLPLGRQVIVSVKVVKNQNLQGRSHGYGK